MSDRRHPSLATTTMRRAGTTMIQRARHVGFTGYLVRIVIIAFGLAIIGLGIYGIVR